MCIITFFAYSYYSYYLYYSSTVFVYGGCLPDFVSSVISGFMLLDSSLLRSAGD